MQNSYCLSMLIKCIYKEIRLSLILEVHVVRARAVRMQNSYCLSMLIKCIYKEIRLSLILEVHVVRTCTRYAHARSNLHMQHMNKQDQILADSIPLIHHSVNPQDMHV